MIEISVIKDQKNGHDTHNEVHIVLSESQFSNLLIMDVRYVQMETIHGWRTISIGL